MLAMQGIRFRFMSSCTNFVRQRVESTYGAHPRGDKLRPGKKLGHYAYHIKDRNKIGFDLYKQTSPEHQLCNEKPLFRKLSILILEL